MERKPKSSYVKKRPFYNTRRTQRNDPCPCGKMKIINYRDANGVIFFSKRMPIKFKDCCLAEQGPAHALILSTHEIINQRNASRFA